jgi:multidrug efflux pump subunit AcrB
VDREKAALNGVTVEQVVQTLRMAVGGTEIGLVHLATEKEDVPILLRLPREERSGATFLTELNVMGGGGRLVPLREIVRLETPEGHMLEEHEARGVRDRRRGGAKSPVYAIFR